MDQVDEFRSWLRLTGKSHNTVRAYCQKISSWQNSGMSQLEWIADEREYGASPATIRMMIAALRSYGKFAGLDTSELDNYKAPPVPDPEPHPVAGGIETVRRVLVAADPGPHRAAVALGALAGLRVSETIAVTRDDIQADSLIIKGKGERVRKIPISEELAHEISAIETHRLVPLGHASTRRGITKLFTRAGVTNVLGKPVSSHDLRATFATEVYRKNNDVRMVQILLGHSKITTTQVYLGVDSNSLREAVEL